MTGSLAGGMQPNPFALQLAQTGLSGGAADLKPAHRWLQSQEGLFAVGTRLSLGFHPIRCFCRKVI